MRQSLKWWLVPLSLTGLLLVGCGTPKAAPAQTSDQAVQAALVRRAERYFAEANAHGTYQVTAEQLYKDLRTDPGRYFLLDVRMPKNKNNYGVTAYGYDAEHIGGAVNIPYPTLGENLGRIPKDKTIITICYTGQWANQTAAILRLLGYRAYALHLSMSAWNRLTDVLPPRSKVPDYPLVAGDAPGSFHP